MFFFKENPLLIRKIRSTQKEVFLTFDDGPDPELTPKVLDLLREEKAHAAFFVIGDAAKKYPELISRMQNEGHSVLSHSKDHGYAYFFRNKDVLKNWLQESLQELSQLTGLEQKAFRPPAGVLTPPLLQTAQELAIPLVLWNHRFFDTALVWTEEKALSSLEKLRPGDIILLHDRQKSSHHDLFLKTLRKYLQEAQERGYRWSALSNSMIETEVQNARQSAL
jgi:peptidoglycan/xylan/chitin deacetylase (PgdA/CDA1 family)